MKNNFEKPENEALDLAYSKALRILSEPIDITDFPNFDQGDIDSDLRYVEKLKRVFAADQYNQSAEGMFHNKLAKIFEAIVFEQIEQSNWLGESAITIQASEFDDFVNGTDLTVELEEEGRSSSHLALAIDVTSSLVHVNEKLDRVKSEINAGRMTQIKYFSSEESGFKGSLSLVPRVVIGAEKQRILQSMANWTEGKGSEMAIDPMQAIIIKEIIDQLTTFAKYAEDVGQPRLAKIYRNTLAIVQRISETKELDLSIWEEAELDGVVETIKAGLKNFDAELDKKKRKATETPDGRVDLNKNKKN